MIYQVLAVYDSKARAFLVPIYCSHVDVGLRALADAANTAGHQIERNPLDFTMFHLGVWNDDNGTFTLLDQQIQLANAASFANSKGVNNVQQQ